MIFISMYLKLTTMEILTKKTSVMAVNDESDFNASENVVKVLLVSDIVTVKMVINDLTKKKRAQTRTSCKNIIPHVYGNKFTTKNILNELVV